MPRKLSPPLKWHGGKYYLAKEIISLLPPHIHYVEPYFGGGAVLLQKSPEGMSEVINDINLGLTNFWWVLQSRFDELKRILDCVPFSQVEWREAFVVCDDADAMADYIIDHPVQAAAAFFVFCRQSMAGRCRSFAPLTRRRTRREMNEQASSWMSAIDGLQDVSQRLRRVVILNDNALRVIKSQDGPDTLFYLDPPYMHDTRVSKDTYKHEMTTDDHKELLDLIVTVQGNVALSGYQNDLYDSMLSGWRVHDIEIDNKASSAKKKRKGIERIWMNYDE